MWEEKIEFGHVQTNVYHEQQSPAFQSICTVRLHRFCDGVVIHNHNYNGKLGVTILCKPPLFDRLLVTVQSVDATKTSAIRCQSGITFHTKNAADIYRVLQAVAQQFPELQAIHEALKDSMQKLLSIPAVGSHEGL